MTRVGNEIVQKTTPFAVTLSTVKSWFVALSFAGVLSATVPATAAEIAPLKVGGWTGGAYTNNQTGVFSHCAASAEYRSGILLLFSVTRDLQWSMGFSNSAWKLTPGQEYPIDYRIDKGRVLKGIALARSAKLAQVMLPAKDQLFNSFRRGRVLRIGAAQEELEFALTGTSRLLTSLLKCAQQYKDQADASQVQDKAASNPFSSGD